MWSKRSRKLRARRNPKFRTWFRFIRFPLTWWIIPSTTCFTYTSFIILGLLFVLQLRNFGSFWWTYQKRFDFGKERKLRRLQLSQFDGQCYGFWRPALPNWRWKPELLHVQLDHEMQENLTQRTRSCSILIRLLSISYLNISKPIMLQALNLSQSIPFEASSCWRR